MRNIRVDASHFLVGRKPEASLCIPSPTVSREHAELTVVDRELLLRDLGSVTISDDSGSYVFGNVSFVQQINLNFHFILVVLPTRFLSFALESCEVRECFICVCHFMEIVSFFHGRTSIVVGVE